MILYLIRHGQSANNQLGEDVRAEYGAFGEDAYRTYMLSRTPEPELTEIGHKQAERLASWIAEARPKHRGGLDDPPEEELLAANITNRLGITRLYTSPMLRTLQTTQPLAAALGIRPKVWVDLHEHGGIFERLPDGSSVGHPGLTRQEMAERFPGYELDERVTDKGWWFGGEEDRPTCDARAIRVAKELWRMAGELGDARIAAIAHGTFLDSLLTALLERLPGSGFHISHYNTGITRLDFTQSFEDGSPFLIVRYTNRVDHLPPELIT